MEELINIWLKLPPELKLLGSTLVGAGFYATSAESISFVKALRALAFALFGGFFGLLLLFRGAALAGNETLTASNFWMAGAFAAYYGDRFWKAAGNVNVGGFVQEYLKQKMNNGNK